MPSTLSPKGNTKDLKNLERKRERERESEREAKRMDVVVGCGPIFAKSSFFFLSSLSFIRDDGGCNAQTNKQNKKIQKFTINGVVPPKIAR
jgi:hypothetical protein